MSNTIKTKIDIAYQESPTNETTGGIIKFYQGSDTDIKVLVKSAGIVQNLSTYTNVIAKISSASDPETMLITKTITSFDADCSEAEFDNGTSQHFTITLSADDLDLSEGTYYLHLTSTISSTVATMASGAILILDSVTGSDQVVADPVLYIPKSLLTTKGDFIARSNTGVTKFPVGSNGQFLKADSSTATGLTWATASGTGDVSGPSSATDNAIARFDLTTGKLLQNSGATISDAGALTASNFSGTFSGTSSGTNTGDQTITLTGDVTGSGTGSFAATIANDAVTYAKMQNVSATDKLLGRSTSGAGDVEEITCTAAGRAILDDADASAQRTTLGLGTIATQAANNVAITGGSITGITDLVVADGGTGLSSTTAYAVLCGGTTSTGALQSIASVGTAGQVLTSNGAGALPTFQSAAAGGGDVTRISTTTISSAASVTISGLNNASYDEYLIIIHNMTVAGDTSFYFEVSNDGGSTYLAGTNYAHTIQHSRTDSATDAVNSGGTTYTPLTTGSYKIQSEVNAFYEMRISNNDDSSGHRHWTITGSFAGNDGGSHVGCRGVGRIKSTTQLTHIKFTGGDFNLAGGKIMLYGIKHA